MPVTLPAVGTAESMASVQIRAQVTGQVGAIHFVEGQEVKQGDPLFTLDQRPFQAALQQAQAALARDQANYRNAAAQQARYESLVQRGILAKDQYETQRAAAEALAATLEADKASIETARVNLLYTSIKAPVSGRTGALGVHVGDLVRSSDSTPLVVINQLSPIYVTFSVPGRFLPDIRRWQARKPLPVTAATTSSSAPASQAPAPGQGAQPALPAPAAPPDGTAVTGTLSFIDNAVDTTTGSIRLKATFPNADHALWPGAFVQVTLTVTTQADAVVAPAIAVQASQDGQYVYVVKADRTVEMRTVKTERQQGDQVVLSGVSAGEVVVTDGHLRLVPGARVSERGENAGPAEAAGARRGGPGAGRRGAGQRGGL